MEEDKTDESVGRAPSFLELGSLFLSSWASLHEEDASLKGTGTLELGSGVTVGLPAVAGVPWRKVGLRSGQVAVPLWAAFPRSLCTTAWAGF